MTGIRMPLPIAQGGEKEEIGIVELIKQESLFKAVLWLRVVEQTELWGLA